MVVVFGCKSLVSATQGAELRAQGMVKVLGVAESTITDMIKDVFPREIDAELAEGSGKG